MAKYIIRTCIGHLSLCLLALAATRAVDAQEETVTCRVTAVSDGEIVVDEGWRRGLTRGVEALVIRAGADVDRVGPLRLRERVTVATAEVIDAGPRSARLRIAALRDAGPPRVGDWVLARIETIAVPVTGVGEDGIRVGAGRDRRLRAGLRGKIVRGGDVVRKAGPTTARRTIRIADVEVVEADEHGARLSLLSPALEGGPRPGDWALIKVGPARRRTRRRRGGAGEKTLVPLLTPLPRRKVGFPESSNIFHGRVWIRQSFQADPRNTLDYSLTRAGSSGSLERIAGTPWNLDWSGSVSYRDGKALENVRYYQEPRFDVRRFAFHRRFDHKEYVRIGRFIPTELSGVGYIDGAQVEIPVGSTWRAGAIGGLKPRRSDLDLSVDEPTAVGYATAETGERGDLYYSGTLGVLGSLYKGTPDRFAVLLDQRADVSSWVSLFSTLEADADIGAAETRPDIMRLTRLDLFATSRVTSSLTLRAGLDHFERPDTQAERDAIDFEDAVDAGTDEDILLDDGFWRYWVGAAQRLPLDLRVDGEVAFLEGDNTGSSIRWRASLTRRGLPFIPRGQLTVTAYNLSGSGDEGYGGNVVAYIPVDSAGVFIRPSMSFRLLRSQDTSSDFEMTDLGVDVDWSITDALTFSAGVSHTFGDDLERTFLRVGLEYRW